MNGPLTFEAVRAITVYVFLGLIIVSLLALFFVSAVEGVCRLLSRFGFKLTLAEGWRDERTLQKFVGGLSVFAVAIISDTPWVMALSLFIGGLIIASERFMRALAIIMKSQSQDLPQALGALTGLEASDASHREIEEKITEEAKVLEPVSPSPSTSSESSRGEMRRKFEEKRKLSLQADESVADFFKKYFGDRYRAQVKISNQYGSIIADGALYSEKDKEEITHFAEIKYFETPTDIELILSNATFWARRALERFRFLLFSQSLMFAIVGKDFTPELAKKVGEELRERFGGFIWPSIFNLKENGSVEVLYPEDLMEEKTD